jgi:hypothetical protein
VSGATEQDEAYVRAVARELANIVQSNPMAAMWIADELRRASSPVLEQLQSVIAASKPEIAGEVAKGFVQALFRRK